MVTCQWPVSSRSYSIFTLLTLLYFTLPVIIDIVLLAMNSEPNIDLRSPRIYIEVSKTNNAPMLKYFEILSVAVCNHFEFR